MMNIGKLSLPLVMAAVVAGCATAPEDIEDYGPKTTTYGRNDLIEKGEITMPPAFSKDDMTELVMGVMFKASSKLPKNVEGDEEPLPVDPSLSTSLQTEMDKLKRFTIVALHGTDTQEDLAAVTDLSNGNIELAEQEGAAKINIFLQTTLLATKSRTVVRGVGSQPDKEEIIYKCYMNAVCKDLRKGTVLFSERVIGRSRPHVMTVINGRPRGGFSEKDEKVAIQKAALNAVIELANLLGNRFPAGGHVIAVSRTGEAMTLDKGGMQGIGVGQQCVIALDDEGVMVPIALAEAYPDPMKPSANLKIYRWNDADPDAKMIINEYKANPRAFFKENKHNLYAACYGVAMPPEWEQNATK